MTAFLHLAQRREIRPVRLLSVGSCPDRVFDSGAVYEATAKPLLNGLLDGYNATAFAYGVCKFP
jgi:hypothetical protein